MNTVHIIDDDRHVRAAMELLCVSLGMRPLTYASVESFEAVLLPTTRGVVLLDLHMPGVSGLMALQNGLARRTHMPIMVLTAFADVPVTVALFEAGALTLIEKPASRDVLASRLTDAVEREARRWAQRAERAETASLLAALTPREREILELLGRGLANLEIGNVLSISQRTVESHRLSLQRKLGVRKIAEAIWLLAQVQATEAGSTTPAPRS